MANRSTTYKAAVEEEDDEDDDRGVEASGESVFVQQVSEALVRKCARPPGLAAPSVSQRFFEFFSSFYTLKRFKRGLCFGRKLLGVGEEAAPSCDLLANQLTARSFEPIS